MAEVSLASATSDDGAFFEDTTFLTTDWLVHMPKGVLAKNFGVPAAILYQIPFSRADLTPPGRPVRGA